MLNLQSDDEDTDVSDEGSVQDEELAEGGDDEDEKDDAAPFDSSTLTAPDTARQLHISTPRMAEQEVDEEGGMEETLRPIPFVGINTSGEEKMGDEVVEGVDDEKEEEQSRQEAVEQAKIDQIKNDEAFARMLQGDEGSPSSEHATELDSSIYPSDDFNFGDHPQRALDAEEESDEDNIEAPSVGGDERSETGEEVAEGVGDEEEVEQYEAASSAGGDDVNLVSSPNHSFACLSPHLILC